MRIAEEPDLLEDVPSIIVNALAGELAVFIERVESAQREGDRSAGRRETTPRAEVRAAGADLEGHTVVGYQPTRDVDAKIGKRDEEVFVISLNRVSPLVVLTPWLVVIPARRPNVAMIPGRSCAFSRRTCSSTSAT